MSREAEDRDEAAAVKFRDDVYLHSVAGHLPGLHTQLYERQQENEGLDWLVPESEEDVRLMMQELATVGVLPAQTGSE